MTLSLARAIQHGGLLNELDNGEQTSTTLAFYGENRMTAFSLPIDAGSGEVRVSSIEDDSGVTFRTLIKAETADEHLHFIVNGEVDTDDSSAGHTLKLRAFQWHGVGAGNDGFFYEDDAVLESLDEALKAHNTGPVEDTPDKATFMLSSLNRTGVEAFVWAPIVRAARQRFKDDLKVIEMGVSNAQVLDVIADPQEGPNSYSITFDFSHKSELPGMSLDRLLHMEFAGAVYTRNDNLRLKDVCANSNSSQCLGGDDECTYDDYVFSRAMGKCSKCAKSEKTKKKFEVK